MSDWDPLVKEWLVDSGNCYAGGIANAEDGAVYAAAADDGDGWAHLYMDDHEQEVVGEDGQTTVKVMINEGSTIKQAVDEGKAPNGVWIGGVKYKAIQWEAEFEYQDSKFAVCFCPRNNGGCHLVKTDGGSIIIALYDTEKNQSAGNNKKTALAMAESLSSQGY